MKLKLLLIAARFYCYNSFLSHFPAYCVRHWFLKSIIGIKIGKNSSVHMGCFFSGRDIEIGNNTVINRNTYLDGRGKLTIGSNVSISPHTHIITLDHDPQSKNFAAISKPVVIEDYCWVGARAMLLPGTRLGKGCVVGAGAVVTKEFPEFSIVAGVPAKVIGQRNRDLDYSLAYFPYFNTDIQPPCQ